MLNYPVIFLLIALGAAGMGFSGIATDSVDTVRALFVIFLCGGLVSLPVRKRWEARPCGKSSRRRFQS